MVRDGEVFGKLKGPRRRLIFYGRCAKELWLLTHSGSRIYHLKILIDGVCCVKDEDLFHAFSLCKEVMVIWAWARELFVKAHPALEDGNLE